MKTCSISCPDWRFPVGHKTTEIAGYVKCTCTVANMLIKNILCKVDNSISNQISATCKYGQVWYGSESAFMPRRSHLNSHIRDSIRYCMSIRFEYFDHFSNQTKRELIVYFDKPFHLLH